MSTPGQNPTPGAATTAGAGASTATAVPGPPGSDPGWSGWISPTSWEVAMLTAMNWPITHTTVTALDAWTLSEDATGHFNGGNNPLAISGMFPGAVKCLAQCNTSSPVMAYGSLQQGIAATVSFLNQNKGAYQNVFTAFQQANYQAEQTDGTQKVGGLPVGNTGLLNDIWLSINQSGWCRGCQGGKYPVQLSNVTNGIALSASAVAALGHSAAVDALQGTPVTGYSASQQGAATPTGFLGLVDPLQGLLSDLTSATFWKRIGIFALGGALTVGGVVIFLASTNTGREAAKAAGTAALL